VPLSARSYSGQFVLVGSSALSSLQGFKPQQEPNKAYVELNPMLLPISCERIRRWVLNELAAPGNWQGKILLHLRPAVWNDPGVLVASDRYRNAWQYRVELPTPVERTVYVRGIVRALLLEMGNRNAEAPGVEIPSWLIEGLTREVLATREIEVILAPPESSANGLTISQSSLSRVREDPVERSYKVLRASGALTFDQLSWPGKTPEAAVGSEAYSANAHVFVSKLLRLPGGRAAMRTMIERLAYHANWQFAFYEGFHAHFQRPLDVEKWWTLQTVYFTGKDPSKSWSGAESHSKLLETIRVPVHVHRGSNSLPSAEAISLQRVLRESNDKEQDAVLARKARELELLRLRVAPEYVDVVERYRTVLVQATDGRSRRRLLLGLRKSAVRAHASREAAHELDRLDGELQAMPAAQPVEAPLAAAQIQRK
jgi:hypothetical protein